jgi:hypothetical protein
MSSLVSGSARILSVTGSLPKPGISERRELFVLTDKGEVLRITLWPPFNSIELRLNDWIRFDRFSTVAYKGLTLASKRYSTLFRLDSCPESAVHIAKSISGGIEYNELQELKAKCEDKPEPQVAYGFIKGLLLSFDNDFTYLSCSKCRKSVSALSDCECEDRLRVPAVKLRIFVQTPDSVIKVTLFSDAVSSLLGFDSQASLADDSEGSSIKGMVSKFMDQSIVLKMKLEKRSFEAEDGPIFYYQYTALPPVFCLIE